MKFYTKTHQYYCGIDLHSRELYVCILDSNGKVLVHKPIKAKPELLLKIIEPYRQDILVGVECMFTWYWVADLCEDHGISFILGHALYMRAIHGGKAKNDKIDSFKIATLMRGGMFPTAYVYPRQKRGARDLLRRRMHMMRDRAELMTHIQNTNSQYNLPEITENIRLSNYEDLVKRFTDPSTQKSIAFDCDLITFYNSQLSKLEWHIRKLVHDIDYHNLMLLRSIPGVGDILSLVILLEIDNVDRFPTVQDFASYCRLVKCKKESAGKIYGTSGGKIGNAFLKWAFSEAAVLFLKNNPDGKAWVEKKAKQFNKAKALTLLAHKLGRAVYFMLQRKTVFDQKRFLNS